MARRKQKNPRRTQRELAEQEQIAADRVQRVAEAAADAAAAKRRRTFWSAEAPPVRCPLKQPETDIQCGLPSGHDGMHSILIPTSMPWFWEEKRPQ